MVACVALVVALAMFEYDERERLLRQKRELEAIKMRLEKVLKDA